MTAQQLDFFLTEPSELLIEDVRNHKASINKLRRGTFATMSELNKQIANLQALYEEIKADQQRLETLLLK